MVGWILSRRQLFSVPKHDRCAVILPKALSAQPAQLQNGAIHR